MKALTTLFNTLLVVLLLAVAGLFFATLAPLPGNIEAKIVQSGSMEPSIPVGALVVIRPFETYAVGEVITFGEDSRTKIPTTHRIESLRHEGGVTYYTTKGDANEEADSREVLHGEVIGRVVLSVPYVGFVLDFAREPLGFALLIGLPAAIIIFDELFNIVVEVRRLRQTTRSVPSSKKRSSDLPSRDALFGASSRARPFSSRRGGYALEDVRVVYTRRRVSDDMFVKRKAFLSAFALFGITGTLLLGNVGSTVSYFNDLERSLSNLLSAGVWGPEEPFELFMLQGNPTCSEITYPNEAKVDPAQPGVNELVVGGLGTISVTVDADDRYFSWSSDFGIDAVIAKGGPIAHVYEYDPPQESFGDTGLHAPLGAGPEGSLPFGISHVSFCYDTDAAPTLQLLQVEAQHEEPAPEDLLAQPGDGAQEDTASTTTKSGEEQASSTPSAVPPGDSPTSEAGKPDNEPEQPKKEDNDAPPPPVQEEPAQFVPTGGADHSVGEPQTKQSAPEEPETVSQDEPGEASPQPEDPAPTES